MAKAIKTVAEAREYAMSKYEQGGDIIVECWDDKQVADFIEECGKKSVRKALDELFRNTNNNEWASQFDEIIPQAKAEVSEDQQFEAYVSSFVRANRVTIVATEDGYLARFFRTHRLVGEIPVALQKSEDGKVTHSNEAREMARNFAIGQCPSYEIEWAPEYQAQAWERKYQKYATDEQVAEDASTLMDMALTGVADKLGYDWDIRFDGIYAKQTSLGYVEDGKYTKDGCWAWADIVMAVILTKDGISTELPMQMEMVSGQIKKCKLNQTSLKAMIQTEQELQTA